MDCTIPSQHWIMGRLPQTRWIIWLWICSMLSYNYVAADLCVSYDLTADGRYGHTGQGKSYSCLTGCPTSGRQVHVVAQNEMPQTGFPNNRQAVGIHIQGGCNTMLVLVIIYREQIKWVIGSDNGFHNLEIILYKPVNINPAVTFASDGDSAGKHVISQKPLDSLLQSNGGFRLDLLSPEVINSVVRKLRNLHGFSAVSSYNVATQLGNWTLTGCCESSTVSPTMSPTVSPTMSPTVSQTVSQTVSAEQPFRSTEGPTTVTADQQEADNIPLVAGLVSLLVVFAAAIAGIALCLYRQKTKRSLTSGTSPSTDPNIYSESPTVTDSNGITRDDPPLSYGEVEYEEAATVKPPVIPPRDKRPK